jgi:putative hydrolase of the HAD superfamily
MHLVLDAANTLIHKPGIIRAICNVLRAEGIVADEAWVASRHRLTSEFIIFPDRTDRQFYTHFNSELLISMGLAPHAKLVDAIYDSCRGLEWQPFPDALQLAASGLSMGVISNFHSGLDKVLSDHFGDAFGTVAISENMGLRKPDPEFYRQALHRAGKKASEVRYVGDSVRLDLVPALSMGMDAWLIDRDGTFRASQRRLSDLMELTRMA